MRYHTFMDTLGGDPCVILDYTPQEECFSGRLIVRADSKLFGVEDSRMIRELLPAEIRKLYNVYTYMTDEAEDRWVIELSAELPGTPIPSALSLLFHYNREG